ncbi:MAG: ABC transporter permease [Chlamydiota bacterium]|nr:ABC transporter permease [Chlamydiota bacterium]
MKGSIRRISAMIIRYVYLHKRSIARTLELIFWPVMELVLWGFVSIYVKSIVQSQASNIIYILINGMIFWDILYRCQQGVSLSFMEEIWTQNIINLLASPLKIWEWLLATYIYGMLKTIIITCILTILALTFYHYNLIGNLGFYLIPLAANLFLFGWAVGIFTSGLIIRWGYAAEALIWGIPFLIQPLSAIYYPLSVLPEWLQVIAKCLPSTYVFEGMRAIIKNGVCPIHYFYTAFILNIIFFLLGSLFFNWIFRKARESGKLVRLGLD